MLTLINQNNLQKCFCLTFYDLNQYSVSLITFINNNLLVNIRMDEYFIFL